MVFISFIGVYKFFICVLYLFYKFYIVFYMFYIGVYKFHIGVYRFSYVFQGVGKGSRAVLGRVQAAGACENSMGVFHGVPVRCFADWFVGKIHRAAHESRQGYGKAVRGRLQHARCRQYIVGICHGRAVARIAV